MRPDHNDHSWSETGYEGDEPRQGRSRRDGIQMTLDYTEVLQAAQVEAAARTPCAAMRKW